MSGFPHQVVEFIRFEASLSEAAYSSVSVTFEGIHEVIK
jgi:hypothetical protein